MLFVEFHTALTRLFVACRPLFLMRGLQGQNDDNNDRETTEGYLTKLLPSNGLNTSLR